MVVHRLCKHGLRMLIFATARDWIMLCSASDEHDGHSLARPSYEGFGRKAHKL